MNIPATPRRAGGPGLRLVEAVYRERDPAFRFPRHVHDVHQWFFCMHGGLALTVDGVEHELGPDDSLLIAPGSAREPSARHRAPGYYFARFALDGIDLTALLAVVVPVPARLRDDVLALVSECREPDDGDSQVLCQALLVRVLLALKRIARDHPVAAQGVSTLNAAGHQRVVDAAEAFLKRHLHRRLRRREVANAVGLSESHLARVLRAATGRSLVDHLGELRVARAKALLLEGALPITEIAGAVGFSSFSHFAKVFKRAVGVTPSDYRRSRGLAWGRTPE